MDIDRFRRKAGQAAVLSVFLFFTSFSNAGFAAPCFCNELGKDTDTWRLNLCAKNPATWLIIEGDAKGELTIHRPSGRFEIQAKGLHPNTEYALVRYEGKPPFGQTLARGFSDAHGKFNGAGLWSKWSKKFWLVLGADLKGRPEDFKPGAQDELKVWRPTEYLFESEELQ